MKLQQLRYIVEVANNGFNVSLTADKLYTSQPSISKQIKQFEEELGADIFQRSGKHLSGLTSFGEQIIDAARETLNKVHDIKMIAQEFVQPAIGELSISTTHTQARYMLPAMIQSFMNQHSQIGLKLEQADSAQCIANLKNRITDFAVISDLNDVGNNIIALPCYHWNYAIIVTPDHPLASKVRISLDELVKYPLISYESNRDGADIQNVFSQLGKTANIALTSADADLIKTYVKLGLGVGIVAKMAMDETLDQELITLNASHLFSYKTTYIAFLRTLYLRGYMYDFIAQFSPYLDKKRVNEAFSCENHHHILTMFNGVKLMVK